MKHQKALYSVSPNDLSTDNSAEVLSSDPAYEANPEATTEAPKAEEKSSTDKPAKEEKK